MKTQWIKSAVLQLIIIHGMSVREYNAVKEELGITKETENNLFELSEKLTDYKSIELN